MNNVSRYTIKDAYESHDVYGKYTASAVRINSFIRNEQTVMEIE